ncbi:MAG: metal ABC transporter substrate-binding protein [Acidobacteriia bacterium]|nr:metal ABC transporter substrate-binding protein [Terriglobia bacterium]
MSRFSWSQVLLVTVAMTGMLVISSLPLMAAQGRIQVAITEADIEAIVRAVGGDHVDTFSLFQGCILRSDLKVEPAVGRRLMQADAIVWTGFFNESAAIYDSVKLWQKEHGVPSRRPLWIDVSRGARRINVPTSGCFDYFDVSFMPGDPFFWLNPHNGAVIAKNVASALTDLRPRDRAFFLANAAAFSKELDDKIAQWQLAMKPLKGLRVFTTQCGWQNFSQMGGPTFIACKGTPGQLLSPEALADQMARSKVQVVIIDPNTPREYERAFRERVKAKIIEVPSSIQQLPGGHTYASLIDNMIKALLETAKD